MEGQDFAFDRCVLCCERTANSIEHVFPRMLGGRLVWRMLCRECNSRTGTRLVSQLRHDPMVVLAIDAVTPQLSDPIRATITERRRLVASGPDEAPVVIERRKGRDKVRARKASDESLIADVSDAKDIIRGMLGEGGVSSEEIVDFLNSLEAAPERTLVDSGKGVSAITHPVGKMEPDLSGSRADDRAMGIIAFGYLALLLGDLIFESYFDPMRDWLRGGALPDVVEVAEPLYAGKYATDHTVASRQEDTDFVVQIVLFGGVVFNVRFRNLVVNGIHFVCRDDLKTGQVLVAEGLEEAKEGLFQIVGTGRQEA